MFVVLDRFFVDGCDDITFLQTGLCSTCVSSCVTDVYTNRHIVGIDDVFCLCHILLFIVSISIIMLLTIVFSSPSYSLKSFVPNQASGAML